MAAKLDLKGVRRLLDLGGGPATYAITFAQANPELKATVFDLPMPIEIARENIAKNGLTDRVDTLAGNFLKDDIGTGYDFIWISQILHSHDEEQCKLIIAKAVAALTPGGTLAIQDFYLNADGASPTGAAMFGVHMLAVTPRGRAYTIGRGGGVDAGGGPDGPGVHPERHGREYFAGQEEVVPQGMICGNDRRRSSGRPWLLGCQAD